MYKRAISIVLASFILMQGMNVHFKDALNIGTLLEHIQLHQLEYGDDIFTFIAKHYGSKISQHKEHNEGGHEELPFHHNICVDGGQLFLVKPLYSGWISELKQDTKKVSIHYNNLYSYLENSEIFQPPRKA